MFPGIRVMMLKQFAGTLQSCYLLTCKLFLKEKGNEKENVVAVIHEDHKSTS